MPIKHSKFIFIISFIEGGVLMAYEVIASKLYTPLIGNSIYVWTSILTITLLGLALGYKQGDKTAIDRPKLAHILLLAGTFMLIIPYVYATILTPFLSLDIRALSIISGVVILLIPMFLLGQVSPILIRLISRGNEENAGYNSGLIYFIGTIGGVILNIVSIFLLLELLGVKKTILVFGLLLIIIGLRIASKGRGGSEFYLKFQNPNPFFRF